MEYWGISQEKINYWMKLSLQQASSLLSNQISDVPIGAIFIDLKTEEIIASACNTPSNSLNPTQHAEINAINSIYEKYSTEAKNKLNNCICIVTIEPCIMCCAALQLSGVKKIIYGSSNKKFGGHLGVLNVNNWIKELDIKTGVLQEEAVELLRKFYKNPNGHKQRRK